MKRSILYMNRGRFRNSLETGQEHLCHGMVVHEQDLCMPSLFSVCLGSVLRSGNLLIPNVVSQLNVNF